jgi:hypothetical protein
VAFNVRFTPQAEADLTDLEFDPSAAKRLKAVRKALGWLQRNPRHPSLNTHHYSQLSGPNGEKVYEAYAQNRTPAAFRIFWCYTLKAAGEITIIAITPHP